MWIFCNPNLHKKKCLMSSWSMQEWLRKYLINTCRNARSYKNYFLLILAEMQVLIRFIFIDVACMNDQSRGIPFKQQWQQHAQQWSGHVTGDLSLGINQTDAKEWFRAVVCMYAISIWISGLHLISAIIINGICITRTDELDLISSCISASIDKK